MTSTFFITLAVCLASPDAPVSSPLPESAPATAKRVLRDDEKSTMRATRSVTAAALESQAASAQPARAGESPDRGCLFAVQPPEPKAFAVHDLVTIVISESSKSKSSADAKAEKSYDMSAEADAFISLDPTSFGDGFLAPMDSGDLPAVGVGADKKFKGKGNFARSDDFTARVTAEIVEVRPNGLLVVEARREIVNDGETQVIVLSGIVRPEDVDSNNQIQSQRIADAVIKKTTTGQLRDASEKGIVAQVLDAIFAF